MVFSPEAIISTPNFLEAGLSTGITVAGGNETSLPQSLRHAFSPPKQHPPNHWTRLSEHLLLGPIIWPIRCLSLLLPPFPPYSQLILTSYPLVAGTPTARNDSCGGPAVGKLFLLSSQLNFRRSIEPVSSSLLQSSLSSLTLLLPYTLLLHHRHILASLVLNKFVCSSPLRLWLCGFCLTDESSGY